MREEGYGSASILLSFLLGGVVGAGLALLLAPQSGTETRRKIKELTDEVKEKTNEYISQTKEKMSGAMDEGKGYYEEKKSLIKSAIEAGKEHTKKRRINTQRDKMHELSIAQNIIEIISEQCIKNGYNRIESVNLRIGRASGIMSDALLFAFDAIKADSIARGAVLKYRGSAGVRTLQWLQR